MTLPSQLEAITADTRALGFSMGSDALTGSFLRTLAASKPGGRLLELGTGTGLATAWLLSGMSGGATLLSVDNDPEAVEVARKHLGDDARLRLETTDGLDLLRKLQGQTFDLVFADTWPGKVDEPELALNLVAPGGFYFVDDMNLAWTEREDLQDPVSDLILGVWEGQRRLIGLLDSRDDFSCTRLEWSTGLMLCTKKEI